MQGAGSGAATNGAATGQLISISFMKHCWVGIAVDGLGVGVLVLRDAAPFR